MEILREDDWYLLSSECFEFVQEIIRDGVNAINKNDFDELAEAMETLALDFEVIGRRAK